jgi:hypothetical protein
MASPEFRGSGAGQHIREQAFKHMVDKGAPSIGANVYVSPSAQKQWEVERAISGGRIKKRKGWYQGSSSPYLIPDAKDYVQFRYGHKDPKQLIQDKKQTRTSHGWDFKSHDPAELGLADLQSWDTNLIRNQHPLESIYQLQGAWDPSKSYAYTRPKKELRHQIANARERFETEKQRAAMKKYFT